MKKDGNKNNELHNSTNGWFGKRDLIEWGIILAIGIVLYTTGLHTEVLGRLQQVVLWTGVIQPDLELPVSEQQRTSYDMKLISLKGEPASLADFKGKVIFLNYWATWCPPCIAEMPNIQALYQDFQNHDQIVFLMISMDEDIDKARRFLQNKEFTFPAYRLASARPKALQSTLLPTTYVIDRQGWIVVEKRGMANYNTTQFRTFLNSLMTGG